MLIRAATNGDASTIAQVRVASWRATYPGVVPQAYLNSLDEQGFVARWRERITTKDFTLIHVVERDCRLCGFAAGGAVRKTVRTYKGELYALYLLAEKQVLRFAQDDAISCGVRF